MSRKDDHSQPPSDATVDTAPVPPVKKTRSRKKAEVPPSGLEQGSVIQAEPRVEPSLDRPKRRRKKVQAPVVEDSASYGTQQLHINQSVMLTGIIISSVLAFPAHLLWGALSDKVGRRPVYMIGALLAAVLAFPFFWILGTGIPILIWFGYILFINLSHNSMNAVQPAFFTESFSARVRYSGASLGRRTLDSKCAML